MSAQIVPENPEDMAHLASSLDRAFNEDGERVLGFALIVAPFSDGAADLRFTCVSNIDEDGLFQFLRVWLDRQGVKPSHFQVLRPAKTDD